MNYIDKGAFMDGVYRYHLWRMWDRMLPSCTFIMLNSSTADGEKDDPTIKKVVKFSAAWGFGRVDVVNLFAFRTKDPMTLKAYTGDPVGIDNDDHIIRMVEDAKLIVCAWGQHGTYLNRGRDVLNMVRSMKHQTRIQALRVSEKTGQPWHPLYIPDATHPRQYP